MRLADFIDAELEELLAEWQAFAATRLPSGTKMEALALRDHAPQILRAIAADLRTAQSAAQQLAKSHGLAPVVSGAPRTAAEAHGALRAQSGFSIGQVVSEYRALRVSVLRLWARADGSSDLATAAEDIMRFNEAIDQAIAESVDFYSQEVDRGRHLFLGILGHELRSPLNAIRLTSAYLGQIRSDDRVSKAAQRLIDSGARMEALLDDLLDYSRTTLHVGIPIRPASTDLGAVCAKVLDEVETARPDRRIELQASGDMRGTWDAKRLHQAFSNLVLNALDHGSSPEPVRIEVRGSEAGVTVSVINAGVAIPSSLLLTIFDPLRRGPPQQPLQPGDTHLGLGLFIAREIIKSHGGRLEATSNERQTVFTAHLPRQSAAG